MARPTCGWGWVVGQITIRIRRRLPRPHTLTASLETRNWAMAARVGRPGLKYGRAFHRPGMRGASTTSVPSRGAFLPRKTQKGTKSFFDRITGLTRYLIFSVSLLRLCVRRKTSWRAWRAWREMIFTQRPQRAQRVRGGCGSAGGEEPRMDANERESEGGSCFSLCVAVPLCEKKTSALPGFACDFLLSVSRSCDAMGR